MCYEILARSSALGGFSEQSNEYSVPTKSRKVPGDLLNHEFFQVTLVYRVVWLFGPLISWLVCLFIDWLDDYLICLLIQSTIFYCTN